MSVTNAVDGLTGCYRWERAEWIVYLGAGNGGVSGNRRMSALDLINIHTVKGLMGLSIVQTLGSCAGRGYSGWSGSPRTLPFRVGNNLGTVRAITRPY